jgi:mono/diheme cytochrome c family protein
MKKIFLIVFLALPIVAQAQTPAAGNADNGKKVFLKQNCYYCHGTAGQGSRDGARIAQTALNLQGLMRYVRKPLGAMPAYTEKILTDQELTDIFAYLKSLPPAKAPKDIKILDDIK